MITNKLKLDLKHCGITSTIDAAQEDILSRGLELSLYDGKKAYLLPENLAVLIQYKKGDGKGGEYDTLPDGRPAWSARRNKLTILLADQMFTFPGSVSMTISLVSDGKQISTFPVQINVLPEAKALAENSEDYFNITGFLVAPGNAEPGQFLKIKSVNSEGRVTQVESGFPHETPADWNAEEGKPGHILNRPFYETEGKIKTIDKKFLPEDIGGVNVSGAVPGQMIIVKSVDQNGKPTQWEAIDPVTGADWNAEEGQPGHILNRPFYSIVAETRILPECQPIYAEDDAMFILPDVISLVAGQDYFIRWNGVTYRRTAWEYPLNNTITGIALGNVDFSGSDAVFLDPFALITLPAEAAEAMGIGIMIMPCDGSTEVTLAISGITETIVPIPKKYLTNARGQKLYTINLDENTADVPVETLMTMDAAEIQSSLTVLYQGVPHSISVAEINEEMFNGYRYCWIIFEFTAGWGQTITFQYHNIGGLTILRTGNNVIHNFLKSDLFLYAKRANEESPTWLKPDGCPFPGIMLKSTTAGSSKQFWITVDDSGNLTATQKSN